MPDYPLSENLPDQLKTPSGLPFSEITLETVLSGRISIDDLRVTTEALEWQAQVAEREGRRQLADNLRRAAELVHVPENLILKIYDSLRPARSTRKDLLALADHLEATFQARRCAELLREAAG